VFFLISAHADFLFVVFSFDTHVMKICYAASLTPHNCLFLIPGDTLGSFIYVPCEVMKQRMQVQGSSKSWALTATKGNVSQSPGTQMYGYYNGMFHAGRSILRDHGLKGLYAGYWHSHLVYE
jgi:hypothetical protein